MLILYRTSSNQHRTTPNQLLNNLVHKNTPINYQSANEGSPMLRLPTINMGHKNVSPLKRQGSLEQFVRDSPIDSRAKVLEKMVFGQNAGGFVNQMSPEPLRSTDYTDFKSNMQSASALKPSTLSNKSQPGFDPLMNSRTIREGTNPFKRRHVNEYITFPNYVWHINELLD